MDLGIKGKNAIVCASSRGLGKACALSLALNGVNVVLNGRDEKVLNDTGMINYHKKLSNQRNELPYEIDGTVFKVNDL